MDKTLEDRINEMIEIIMNVAREDFAGQISLSGKNDEIDSLAIGINMMIDDIKNYVEELKIEKDKVAKKSKELDEKIQKLKQNELATLNIMEDLQNAQKELEILNEQLENKVQERTNEVELLLKQKDEFINQLGHDLKTPITPLITLSPIVERRVKDSELKDIMNIIIRNINYMKNLIYKTLELARLNSPNIKFEFENTNLLTEIDNVIENKLITLENQDITIENKINENIFIEADSLRISEVFDNLITNSIKYMQKNGKITIDAKKDGDAILISVADTGIGMESEQIKHIFDEFYKVDESRHDRESIGLGLSICKRIVERHGGKIWVESKGKNKGSTFYFTLKTKINE